MLENKQIIIGDNEYRLTIEKDGFNHYYAYLSDFNSPYTEEAEFYGIYQLKKKLKGWIIGAHLNNNQEKKLFEKLNEWDGVLEV